MQLKVYLLSIVFALATNAAQAYEWQALPDKAPEPADNPTTPEKVELGRLLYMDPASRKPVQCPAIHVTT